MGHEAVVRLLLDGNANANQVNFVGQTPLNIATAKGYEPVMRHLLEHNANVKATD
jgi:ankyrin repeat protein